MRSTLRLVCMHSSAYRDHDFQNAVVNVGSGQASRQVGGWADIPEQPPLENEY